MAPSCSPTPEPSPGELRLPDDGHGSRVEIWCRRGPCTSTCQCRAQPRIAPIRAAANPSTVDLPQAGPCGCGSPTPPAVIVRTLRDGRRPAAPTDSLGRRDERGSRSRAGSIHGFWKAWATSGARSSSSCDARGGARSPPGAYRGPSALRRVGGRLLARPVPRDSCPRLGDLVEAATGFLHHELGSRQIQGWAWPRG